MARCQDCTAYGSRPGIGCLETWLILGPLERTGLDNITSQPWTDTICPGTIASSTWSSLFKQKAWDKAEVSTWRGGTGAICVRPWLTRDTAWTGSLWWRQARFGGNRKSENRKRRTLNTRLSSGTSAGTVYVPLGLVEMIDRNRYEKRSEQVFCTRSKKRVRESVLTFRTQDLVDFVFEGFRSTLKVGLGISRTNADSQLNPVYNVFHRNFCCGNETIRR